MIGILTCFRHLFSVNGCINAVDHLHATAGSIDMTTDSACTTAGSVCHTTGGIHMSAGAISWFYPLLMV